jgi:hypothetical protein
MNKKAIHLFFTCLLLQGSIAFGQKSAANVNTLTGTANVVIPVYTLSRGAVSMPINLVYSATGVKPKDVEGTAGMGWQLQAGGQISRQVRGIPDDAKRDVNGNGRTGWLYNDYGGFIASFTPANTGNGNCTQEAADISYINSEFADTTDTEPDLFYVNAPGLSCQLVFDNVNQVFRTIPYQDVKITYTTDPAFGLITSFTIINDRGIKYVFAAPEFVQQQTVTSGSSGTYFQNTYKQYQHAIQYDDAWNLTSMTDAIGNGVIMVYSAAPKRISKNPIILYGGAPGGTTVTYNQYTIQQMVTPQVLDSIKATDGTGSTFPKPKLAFTWTTNPVTSQTVIQSVTGLGRNFQFNYSPVNYTPSQYTRYFLRSYTDAGTGKFSGCSTPVNYQFGYNGETETFNGYTTALPDSTSTDLDYWGFFTAESSETDLVPSLYVNPSNSSYQRYAIKASLSAGTDYTYTLNSENRAANPGNVMIGSLQTITYPQGGNTTLTYESSDYLDIPSNTNVQGGGIRIKQIKDQDNVTGKTVTRNYSYIDPSTGKSSGKPVSLPVYGFTIPYTGTATGSDFWNYATMRSSTDLSQEDHTIMYAYAKMTQAGAGSTQYQYYIPAANWDNTATPACSGCTADWAPTTDYVARPTCVNYGPIKNDIDTYPFALNPNYDFERGLLLSVTTYNEATTPLKTSETDYTYQRTSAPGQIYALKFDNNPNAPLTALAYAKYAVNYGTSELTATETKKIFDSQNLGQAQTTIATYTYGSTYHKLASQQATNSDLSVLTTHYTYTKDYAAGTSTNNYIQAIYNLQQLNINAPVESYTTITRGGGSPSVINATLNLYMPFNLNTLNMPGAQFKLVQPNGGGSFAPLTISGSSLTYDPRYFTVADYTNYDYNGTVQTADDGNKNVRSAIIDHVSNNTVLTIKNAASNEIGYTTFDGSVTGPWLASITGTFVGTAPAGSHTGNSQGLSSGQAFTYTVIKNAQASNYIFSVWISSTSGGSFAFTMTQLGSAPTTITKTFAGTGTKWQYFEWKLPVPFTAGTFSVSAALTSAANIGIDDVLFYPETAEVTTYTYDPTSFYKIAQTNTNGVSAYYANDQWGRPLFGYDQDKNIVGKNTYITPGNIQDFNPSLSAEPSTGVTPSTPVILTVFNAGDPCTTAGNTYTWNFNDGSPQVTNDTTAVTHTYTTANTYNPTVTVNSPYFGSKISSTSVTVTNPVITSVRVHYTNTCETTDHDPSAIANVTFSQLGVMKYSFSAIQLEAGQTIAPGSYDIVITPVGTKYNSSTNPTGYSAVTYRGAVSQCFPYSETGTPDSISDDLSNTADVFFQIQPVACP